MNQDSSLQPTVVILLSDKRSGSTVFQTELLNHPQVNGLDYSSHTYLESHHWLKAAVMMGMPQRLFSGGQTYPGYGSRRNARTYMIDTLMGNLPEFVPPAEDKGLIFAGWEALCRHYARPVFFEKSPQVLANWAAISMLLDWMAHTEFNVRLVGLVRNPMAVQHSSEKLFATPPDERQHGWAEIYRNLLALQAIVPQDQLMILRHEDILFDPQKRFADVCRFIGLRPDPNMGQQIHDKTQNRWREDPSYGLQLAPGARQIAMALGYSAAELENPTSPSVGTFSHSQSTSRRVAASLFNRFRDRVLRPARMRRKQTFTNKEQR